MKPSWFPICAMTCLPDILHVDAKIGVYGVSASGILHELYAVCFPWGVNQLWHVLSALALLTYCTLLLSMTSLRRRVCIAMAFLTDIMLMLSMMCVSGDGGVVRSMMFQWLSPHCLQSHNLC